MEFAYWRDSLSGVIIPPPPLPHTGGKTNKGHTWESWKENQRLGMLACRIPHLPSAIVFLHWYYYGIFHGQASCFAAFFAVATAASLAADINLAHTAQRRLLSTSFQINVCMLLPDYKVNQQFCYYSSFVLHKWGAPITEIGHRYLLLATWNGERYIASGNINSSSTCSQSANCMLLYPLYRCASSKPVFYLAAALQRSRIHNFGGREMKNKMKRENICPYSVLKVYEAAPIVC